MHVVTPRRCDMGCAMGVSHPTQLAAMSRRDGAWAVVLVGSMSNQFGPQRLKLGKYGLVERPLKCADDMRPDYIRSRPRVF